jgi:MFS family permease
MSVQHEAASETPTGKEPAGLNRGQWLVLIAAFLGWMFDGVELGLFSGVARPVLLGLLGLPDEKTSDAIIVPWISFLMASFLLGAACGGVFFGWLGDRIGRVRAMALSILAYSLFTGLCCLATSPWQLGVLRFLAALGMGGEWSLGVALVVECWPERLRPLLSGGIGATGNVGYLMIGLLVRWYPPTPDHWRWIMVACATPAVLALFIVLWIPESKRWRQSVRRTGPGPLQEILTTRLIRPTLLAIGLASVALIGTWGCVQAFLPSWAGQLAGREIPNAGGTALVCVSIGAMLGGLLGPLVGGKIGRRPAYFAICLGSLVTCQLLYYTFDAYNNQFLLMAGIVGCFTAAFYGWLPLYLPELFPTRVRATGQGLSYNFGRIFAMFGVLVAGQLPQWFKVAGQEHLTYPRTCATISLIYVVGMVLIWFAPETKGKPLPD